MNFMLQGKIGVIVGNISYTKYSVLTNAAYILFTICFKNSKFRFSGDITISQSH